MDRTIHWNPKPRKPFPWQAFIGAVTIALVLFGAVVTIVSILPSKKEAEEHQKNLRIQEAHEKEGLSDYISLIKKGELGNRYFWIFKDREGNEYFKFGDGDLVRINQKKIDIPASK